MINVLLLGAGGNAGVNFVKSLKRSGRGYRVIGTDLDPYNLSSCNADVKVLLPRVDPQSKTERILDLVQRWNIDFVHAQPDPEVKYLIESQSALEGRAFNHSLAAWTAFSDKLRCQQTWARALGLGFASHSLADITADPEKFDALIAGNGQAWIRAMRGAGSRAALPVKTLEQATAWARYWVEMRGLSLDDFMVAEYLDGNEYAVQTFWLNGELIHSQARERLVYFFGSIMPSGQSSTPAVARTVADRDVYDTAYRAISAIDQNPHGIYCVDLKRNSRGEVIPMEVNYGRFFTTNDFFASIGVNTPDAYVTSHLGIPARKRVESVHEESLWIRGLDKEPVLLSRDDLALPELEAA